MIICLFKGVDIFIPRYIPRSMGPNTIITSKGNATCPGEGDRSVPGFTASVSSTLRIKPGLPPGTSSAGGVRASGCSRNVLSKGIAGHTSSPVPNPGGFACRHHRCRRRLKTDIGRDTKRKGEGKR